MDTRGILRPGQVGRVFELERPAVAPAAVASTTAERIAALEAFLLERRPAPTAESGRALQGSRQRRWVGR